MTNPTKKTQHYVPQLLLEGFVNDEGKVIELLIPQNKIYPTNPANAMAENYTYEHPNIEKNAVENLLSLIEGKTAPFIKELRSEVEENGGEGLDIAATKKKVEQLYSFYILSYYRSGALLKEYASFKKEDRVPLLTLKISDFEYLRALKQTIKLGYDFAILRSQGDFLLSDQCVSTVGLKVKSNFFEVSNRHIGIVDTLILIPISSSYYIALWNTKDSFFGVQPDTVHTVDDKLLYLINRAILNNSYIKCVSQKEGRLAEVLEDFKVRYPSQVYAGGNPTGYVTGAIRKKEVFLTDLEIKVDELLDFSSLERYKDVERNDKCPCGSNIRFKKCHLWAYERLLSVQQTFNGPFPFGKWQGFVIPGVPVIEYPIDKWAGYSKDTE